MSNSSKMPPVSSALTQDSATAEPHFLGTRIPARAINPSIPSALNCKAWWNFVASATASPRAPPKKPSTKV
jgi:hypothetical protein